MSKKFRSLVGAMLSASVCSSCMSSGLSKGVKWAVGVPVTGALVYLGGRKLGFWGTSRRKEVQLNYIAMDGEGNLLGDDNGNDDAPLSDEKRVARRAGEIKKLVKEEDYNKLKAFCDEVDKLDVWFRFEVGKDDVEVARRYLKEMLELIFVSGECDIFEREGKNDVGFCVSVPLCTFTISFRTNGKVVIIVDDKRCGVTRLVIII